MASTRSRSAGAGRQHAAHGRDPGRQAAAHGQVDGHDLVRGQAQDVDHVGAFQHRHGTGLARLLGHFLHVRQRQVPQRRGGQVGVAQLQDARREREPAVLDGDVAQVLQRQQDARAGARQAGHGRDFGQRHLRAVGAERPDHGQAAREGLHVAVAGLLGVLLGHRSAATYENPGDDAVPARLDARVGPMKRCSSEERMFYRRTNYDMPPMSEHHDL